MAELTERERAVRLRLHDDFEYYAPRCLKIITKPDAKGDTAIVPFAFNTAQAYVHKRIEAQRAARGWVRAMVLKGRQQGISTYAEGRYYWKTTQRRGQKTYILTHKQEATDNLFGMVDRYHKHAPVHVQPQVGRSNAKELAFPFLDSSYQVATAGAKGAGRSATLINVHGSEVGFWENGDDHLKGMLQAVPLAPGTEVILESTANGVGNVFHAQWQLAESGQSDFIAIFVPWFWQSEYSRDPPSEFSLLDDPESVPEGELTETEFAKLFGLALGQMAWRRAKIAELGGGERGYWAFKQEYPATADEAFQAAGAHGGLLSRRLVLRARKAALRSDAALVIGVDPAGDGDAGDRTAIIRRRARVAFNPQTLNGMNTMQIVALLHRIIKTEKPLRMFVDVGGLGKGIVDRLFELAGTRGVVVPVNFGEAALDPETYVNRRAEMWWEMSDWMASAGGVMIPDSDELQADLLSVVADDPDSNQRRRLKSKKWMRSQGLRSPDLGDALALTFALPVGAEMAQPIGSGLASFDPLDGAVDHGMVLNDNVNFDPL